MAEERENWGTVRIDDEVLAGGFVQVPAVVIFDPDLSPGAKTTYGSLLWFAWKWGRAPDQVQWGKMLGVTARTISGHLAELEKCGLIERMQYGLGRPNDYIIKTIVPSRKKSSGLGGSNLPVQQEEIFPSYIEDSDSTTQKQQQDVPADPDPVPSPDVPADPPGSVVVAHEDDSDSVTALLVRLRVAKSRAAAGNERRRRVYRWARYTA